MDQVDWVDQVDLVDHVDQMDQVDIVDQVNWVDQVDCMDHVDHVDRVDKVDRPYSPVFSALLCIKLWFCRHFVLCRGASCRVLAPPPAGRQLRKRKQ